jgi:hypothetical protein
MPSKNPAQRLRDIAENIEAIRDFTSGMDVELFLSSRRTIYAVTRAPEIIFGSHAPLTGCPQSSASGSRLDGDPGRWQRVPA